MCSSQAFGSSNGWNIRRCYAFQSMQYNLRVYLERMLRGRIHAVYVRSHHIVEVPL